MVYNHIRKTPYILNEWRIQSRRPVRLFQTSLDAPAWKKENTCIVNGERFKEYAFDGKIDWKTGISNEAICLASIARGYPRTKLVVGRAMELSILVPDATSNRASCNFETRCSMTTRKALSWIHDIVNVIDYFHSRNQPFSTVFTSGMIESGIFVTHESSITDAAESSNILQGYALLCEWGGSSHTTGSKPSLYMQPPEALAGIPTSKRNFKKEDIWRIGEWSGIILSKQSSYPRRRVASPWVGSTTEESISSRSRLIRLSGLITEIEPVSIRDWPELRCGKHFSENLIRNPRPPCIFGKEHIPVLPTDIASPIRMLLAKCLRIVPKRRVGLDHIQKSPVFVNIHSLDHPRRIRRRARPISCVSQRGLSTSGRCLLNHLMRHCTVNPQDDHSKKIPIRIRRTLIAWMHQITQYIHATDDTFFLSVRLINIWIHNMRFNAESKMETNELYATALACIWISSKLQLSRQLYATDMVRHSDMGISVSKLLHKEREVIDDLNGHVDRVTCLHFLRVIMAELYCTQNERILLTLDLVSRTIESQVSFHHPLETAWNAIIQHAKSSKENIKQLRDAIQSMDLVNLQSVILKDVQAGPLHALICSPSPKKSTMAPCKDLPIEIFVHILSFLPFREVVKTSQVSKLWNQTSHHPSLLNRPWCLSRAEFPCISNRALNRNVVPRMQECKVRHLDLSDQVVSSMTVLNIILSCTDLKTLCVSNVKIGKRVGISIQIGKYRGWKVQTDGNQYKIHLPSSMRLSLECIDMSGSNLFIENPNVMEYIVEQSPYLKKLNAQKCNCISKSCIRALTKCNEIEELSLDSSSKMVDPYRVSINDMASLVSSVKTESLCLNLRCISGTRTNNRRLVQTLLRSSGPRIKSLSLTGYLISSEDIIHIINVCSFLKGLRVLTGCVLDLNAFSKGYKSCQTHMVALSIGSFARCTPECIQNMFTHFPKLKELHLYRGTVSDSALVSIIKYGSKLKRFMMRSCEGYTSFGINLMYARRATADIHVIEGRPRHINV